MHKKHRITFVLIFIVVLAISVFFSHRTKEETGVMCTMDAKLCSDGSQVSRTGPSCEFAECPKGTRSIMDTSAWKTVSDSTTGVTFKYPQDLNTTYINASDWPPQVQVLSGPFACVDAGEPNAR